MGCGKGVWGQMPIKKWVWGFPAWVRFGKVCVCEGEWGVGVLFCGCVGIEKVVNFFGDGYGVWDVGGRVNVVKRVGLAGSGLGEV